MRSSAAHEVVCFGEVLWDVLPSAELPGGAPMNVAYHLKKLGIDPALITATGKDERGDQLKAILSAANVNTEYFQTDEQYDTGVVFANVNNANEVFYDIVFPSAWDFIQFDEKAAAAVKSAVYFVFGSLTSRSEVSRKSLYRYLEAAQTKVCDINLRSPHFERASLEYLLARTDLLKMNESELQLISEWYGNAIAVEERIESIQHRFNINTVIVTMGGEGAMVNDNGRLYKHKGFKVKVADTIGSGDSFLAGFLSQKLKDKTTEEALQFASAIGAFIATQNGACPNYTLEEVERVSSE